MFELEVLGSSVLLISAEDFRDYQQEYEARNEIFDSGKYNECDGTNTDSAEEHVERVVLGKMRVQGVGDDRGDNKAEREIILLGFHISKECSAHGRRLRGCQF